MATNVIAKTTQAITLAINVERGKELISFFSKVEIK